MILNTRNLLVKSVLGGLFLMSVGPVEAGCNGRSGGGSYSSGHSSYGGYSGRVHSSPVYHQPVYSSPVYSQPVYSQHSYPQPVYSQPVYSQPQPVQVSTTPVYSQSQTVYHQSQPSAQYSQVQPTVSAQPTYSTSGQTVQMGSLQGNTMQVSQTSPVANGQNPVSSMTVGQSGFVGQTNSVTQNGAPQNMSMPSGPAQSNLVPSNTTVAPSNTAPVNSQSLDAQQSALQALGGFAPPQAAAQSSTTPAPAQAQQNPMAGSWTANLPNGARVQLTLQADGNFSWTAVNKDGQSSVFQGSYSVENGALSLTRGNDGQKLQGSMSMTGSNNFSFKLAADQASSLEFVRG